MYKNNLVCIWIQTHKYQKSMFAEIITFFFPIKNIWHIITLHFFEKADQKDKTLYNSLSTSVLILFIWSELEVGRR